MSGCKYSHANSGIYKRNKYVQNIFIVGRGWGETRQSEDKKKPCGILIILDLIRR
jgi:hypothetical protein